jgi:hypothetical protein
MIGGKGVIKATGRVLEAKLTPTANKLIRTRVMKHLHKYLRYKKIKQNALNHNIYCNKGNKSGASLVSNRQTQPIFFFRRTILR